MGELVQFVPRDAKTRRPMLEQLAHEVLEQITVPRCHDELVGGSVREALYETSLGFVDMNPYHGMEIDKDNNRSEDA